MAVVAMPSCGAMVVVEAVFINFLRKKNTRARDASDTSQAPAVAVAATGCCY